MRSLLAKVMDAATQCCRAPDARSARLFLALQAAGARLGLVMPGRATGPGLLLGQCACALGPRDAMALAWAWTTRGGAWNADNTALLHEALDASGASTVAAAASPVRAALELELLAGLAVQPPPAAYLASLLEVLAGGSGAGGRSGSNSSSGTSGSVGGDESEDTDKEEASDAEGPHAKGARRHYCPATRLPYKNQASLLLVLAKQPRLWDAPGAAVPLKRLLDAMLHFNLRTARLTPDIKQRLLSAVVLLHERHGFVIPSGCVKAVW
jgi:hypothetical protein